MMKGIVMTTLFILTIFLTVLLAHNWQGLDSEQQAFVELAAYIEDKKKNVLDSHPSTYTRLEKAESTDSIS